MIILSILMGMVLCFMTLHMHMFPSICSMISKLPNRQWKRDAPNVIP